MMEQDLIKKYIAGWASEDEKDRIMVWVKNDPKNRDELMAMRKLYDVTLWQQSDVIGHQKKTVRLNLLSLVRIASVAAVFLLLAGMSWYIFDLKQQVPVMAMHLFKKYK